MDLFLEVLGGLEKGRWGSKAVGNCLLGAGVLGDSLGSLRDGVLGQLSGQDQTDGGLDFPAGDVVQAIWRIFWPNPSLIAKETKPVLFERRLYEE